MIRRNGPVTKSVELVLRLEGSLWWERFVKEVGFEPGVFIHVLLYTIIEMTKIDSFVECNV